MADQEDRSLIPLRDVSLANTAAGASRILAAMVEQTLALTRQEPLSNQFASWRIGNYGFCEPDYRQILLWAKALDLEPVTVVERVFANLPECHYGEFPAWAGTRFEEGRIVTAMGTWTKPRLDRY